MYACVCVPSSLAAPVLLAPAKSAKHLQVHKLNAGQIDWGPCIFGPLV